MLENNQQCTESRTTLVEDIVNVVEDRVNVVEDSVHHLQGDLSIFVINSEKGTQSLRSVISVTRDSSFMI